MITKEQIENLGFIYKQKLITNHIDFVHKEINVMVTLSQEGMVDIISENYKKNWSNIESIDLMKKIVEDIEIAFSKE